MSVTQRWNQLWQTCKTATRDSATLMREVLRAPADWRTAVVTQARRQPEHNTVAVQLLWMEKTVNDMRYYGISQYMKTRFPSLSLLASSNTSGATPTPTISSSSSAGATPSSSSVTANASSSSSSSSSSTTTATTPPPKVAKIAFMITSTMKQELAILGYSTEDTKRMTPLHASLVLEHSIPPVEYDSKLPILVEEYNKNQEMEAQSQRIKRQEEEERMRQQQEEIEFLNQQQVERELQQLQVQAQVKTNEASEAKAATTIESDETSSHTVPVQPTLQGTSSSSSSSADQRTASTQGEATRKSHSIIGFASHNLLHQPAEKSGREWFQIVETSADGNQTVTALYLTEKEAQEGLLVRQKVAARRAKDRSSPATSSQTQQHQTPQMEIRRVIKY